MANPDPVILDSNVPFVANDRAAQASEDCVLACIQKLREVMSEKILVLDFTSDVESKIVAEYKSFKRLNPSGQPGPGDAFLRWVLENQANSEHCELIPITETAENEFAEIPAALSKMLDPSDRKFVAVALAHKDKPPIVNAVDSDWREVEAELTKYDVRIEFICQAEMDKPRQPRISKREQKRTAKRTKKEG